MKDPGVFYRSTPRNMRRVTRVNAREWIGDHELKGVVVHATHLEITDVTGRLLTASFNTPAGTASFVQKHLKYTPRTYGPNSKETRRLLGDAS